VTHNRRFPIELDDLTSRYDFGYSSYIVAYGEFSEAHCSDVFIKLKVLFTVIHHCPPQHEIGLVQKTWISIRFMSFDVRFFGDVSIQRLSTGPRTGYQLNPTSETVSKSTTEMRTPELVAARQPRQRHWGVLRQEVEKVIQGMEEITSLTAYNRLHAEKFNFGTERGVASIAAVLRKLERGACTKASNFW
jgi:hypothetical protein